MRRRGAHLLYAAALAIVVMAVPLFLVTTNLRTVINSGWLYKHGFERHGVAEATGIEKPELMRISREIKRYFNSSDPLLDVHAVVNGRERPLFNEREIIHMKDVKGLVKGLAFWQMVSFLSMAGIAVLGLTLMGRARAAALVGRGLLLWSLLTIALLAAAGIGSLIGFDWLFTTFHEISFDNDFWMLDPATDYLVRIFPEGFFLDATLIVAGLTLAQAALTVGGVALLRWRLRR